MKVGSKKKGGKRRVGLEGSKMDTVDWKEV